MAERLTLAHTYQVIEHALGGRPTDKLTAKMIADMAGEHLFSMHQWAFAKGRSALLDLRGSISFTDADWTEGTLTLTKTAAFTNYTFVSGDKVQIQSGTDVNTGFYTVASRTSANAIVLTASIQTSGGTADAIAARLDVDTVALPSDFGSPVSITSSDNTLYGVTFTTIDEINKARATTSLTSGGTYRVAVVFNGDPPVQLLEIYPSADANQTGVWTLFYRKEWDRNADDQDTLPIPEFAHPLYFSLAAAFGEGWYDAENGTLEERVAAVVMGPICMAAKQIDGMAQQYVGSTSGGGAVVWGTRFDKGAKTSFLTGVIAAPS